MKIIPAIFFVAAGIWVAVNYPDIAQQAYVYIEQAIAWATTLFNDVMNK
jgi:hypothetical protein